MGLRDEATMENLPHVLLSNIFTRLLAKQLAQMRCVSKSWNTLLSQSFFIRSHLDRSIQNNKNDGIFLVFPHLFSFASKRIKPFTAHSYRSPILELPNFIKLSGNHQSGNRRGKVIGSVNGLICFKYGTNLNTFGIYRSNHDPVVIYIWNPSLSALLTLPPYNIPPHSIKLSLRFGFDPKSDDYKVVKISRHFEKLPNTYSEEWLPIEVYSMRKGSWKLITEMIPPHLSGLVDRDILCVDGHDGHLHWIAETNNTWYFTLSIFTFDLGSDTFHEMPLPVPVTRLMGYYNTNDVSVSLGVMCGKLCVMTKAKPDYQFEVWVMKEYGVAESWVKHHVFPPYRGNYTYGYGFTLSNEFVIQLYECGLALYDPVEAKTKLFKFGYDRGITVVDYVDSLVWVTPDERREMRGGRFSDRRRSPPPRYSRLPRYTRSPPPRYARSPSRSRDYAPPPRRRQYSRSTSPRDRRYSRERSYTRSPARERSPSYDAPPRSPSREKSPPYSQSPVRERLPGRGGGSRSRSPSRSGEPGGYYRDVPSCRDDSISP